MKKLLKIFIFLIAPILGGYLFFFCFFIIEKDSFCVIEDSWNGNIIKILDSGYSFIPEGVVPDKIRVYKLKKKITGSFNLRVPIPALKELKSNFYSLGIPVSLSYEVTPDKLAVDFTGKSRKIDILNRALENYMVGSFSREISSYFGDLYRKSQLSAGLEKIIFKVKDRMRTQGERIGITISNFSINGSIYLPDERIYSDGLAHLKDLMSIEKSNERELKKLRHKLKSNKITNEQFYSKLKELSGIIKGNPDILKYLYIDRFAEKVKVIMLPERTGLPFGMDIGSIDKYTNEKGEIDKLR